MKLRILSSSLLLTVNLLLSACASTSGSPSENPGAYANNATGTVPVGIKKTGWQVENSALSAHPDTFIQQVSERYRIPANYVRDMLNQAQVNDRVITLMSPTTIARVKRHWPTYRSRFVEPIRIRKGTEFWNAHRSALEQAERQYGVPAAVIASIIGVETVYGEQLGSFKVLDALYSLGFHHPDSARPEKSQMFRNQLAALIELDHKGLFDGKNALGSFAGASGLPQFMPISILHYAVDADKSGKIDLRTSHQDAIYSVANFLVKHGWQSKTPIFAPVTLPANPSRLVDGGLEVNTSWSALQSKGARSHSQGAAWQQGQRLGVIDLKDEVRGNHEYRTATQNFFAITKYNRSYFYAASVADLARELAFRQQQSGHKVTMP